MGVCNSDWSVIGRTIANRVPMWVIWVLSVFTVGWIIGDAGFIGLVGWYWTGWLVIYRWKIGGLVGNWQWFGGLVTGWSGADITGWFTQDWPRIGIVLADLVWHLQRIGDGFPDGLGLALYWWISDGFTDWSRIGIGLTDWSWICTGLEDWRCIGFLCFVAVALTAWEIIHRGDTSVGPHRILVPRLYAQLSSDWYIIGVICVNAWQCPANRWQSSFDDQRW